MIGIKLGRAATILDETSGFAYMDSRDLIGFVAAENSMGIHAPQELARILGETIDYARQGQLAAERALPPAGGSAPSAARQP